MARKVPEYSFTGEASHELIDGTWYIFLKSTGDFKMLYGKGSVDVFLCGGGGGGESVAEDDGGSGGAGGYLTTRYGVRIDNISYPVIVGAGGEADKKGGDTKAFGYIAEGGSPGDRGEPGTLGTGAGGKGGYYWDGANIGYDGGDAVDGRLAFNGDTSLGNALYGGGGGGGGSKVANGGKGGKTGGADGSSTPGGAPEPAAANMGGGGGGSKPNGTSRVAPGGLGGSGVVILRGTENDFSPVWFNGTQVSEIFFNGERVEGFIYDGVRLFARRCKEWLSKCLGHRSECHRVTPAL